jgi:EAL domain-containing protein (putative c-di-GMP-specific phosphodiesterase class I)
VITRVCKQIAEWQRAGKGPFQVAVNVSGQQIIEGDFRPLPIKELEDFLRERQCFT